MKLRTWLSEKSTVRLNLMDLNGKAVYEENLGVRESGALDHDINVSTITKGLYIIRVHQTTNEGVVRQLTKKISIE